MANATQNYKRSFSNSVGAGMKSLMGNEGRRYYILEHKISSKYHRVGESQKIIIDQIELGRDPNCQVRFDDSFTTVSRRHAAITKDGDNWKLVQLSQVNTTYLNGKAVNNEWYLQNGDEIQLSTNGPKLGFIVPQGEKGLVKSIGMTARLNLFRKQALQPYKQAMTVLSCVLLLCVFGGGYALFGFDKKNKELGDKIGSAKNTIDSLTASIADYEKTIAVLEKATTELNKKVAVVSRNLPPKGDYIPAPPSMKHLWKDVYWIKAYKVEITYPNGDVQDVDYGWIATGFLLENGTFVTARHCVEGWRFPNKEKPGEAVLLSHYADHGAKVKAYINAFSNDGTVLHFTSDQFKMTNHNDQQKRFEYVDEKDGEKVTIDFMMGVLDGTDYAYCMTDKKGTLKYDSSLSRQIAQQTKVYVLGYPHGFGAGTDVKNQQDLEPSYGESIVARTGITDNGSIQLSNRTFESGNSGGPVFVYSEGEYKVVAIVSASIGNETIGFVTPIFKID